MRRFIAAATVVILISVVWLIWNRTTRVASPAPAGSSPKVASAPAGTAAIASSPDSAAPRPTPATAPSRPVGAAAPWNPADYPLAAPLNAPDSTIARDLDSVRLILEAWRSNFPREGNPVGENADITSALTGNNRLELVLIPKNHPAVNAQGELCDRWGTPFRLHQLSGEKMELRSAGPDRKFATADDVLLTPE